MIAMFLGLTILITAITLVGGALRAAADPPMDYGDPGSGTGSISGTVTVPAGEVVTSVYLELTPADGRAFFSINVQPSVTGSYTFASLADGDYYVGTNNSYLPGYLIAESYDDSPWYAGTVITVAGGLPVTGIDLDLARGGKVSGTVTVSGGGPATGSGYVTLYDASQVWVAAGYVDPSDGSFTTEAVPAGTYYARFEGFDNGAPEWYDDAANFGSATPITVTVGATTTANAVLPAPGAIGGTVTVTGGAPATGGLVNAYLDGEFTPSVTTFVDGSGAFSMVGLLPGDYLLEFSEFENGVHGWYSGADTRDDATPVSVSAGATTSISAVLALGGHIGGDVTVVGGGAPGFGRVEVLDSDGVVASTTYTDGTDYISGALAPGSYRVQFLDFPGSAYEWYNDSPSYPGSSAVVVSVGATATVNAVLEPESVISGTIMEPDGSPASGGCVYAYENWYGHLGDYRGLAACIDSAGHYEIHGLAAGSYILGLEYFDGHDTIWAGPVTTTEGATTVFDYRYTAPGSITATVTLDGGGTASTGCVGASRVDSGVSHIGGYSGGYTGYSETCDAVGGVYTIAGLEVGDYVVSFQGFGDWAGEFYDDVLTYSDATPVTVAEDTDTAIAATLAPGGSASGTVTMEGGGPAIGVTVDAILAPSYEFVGTTTTDASGNYTLPGLPAGDVILSFRDLDTAVAEYYDDARYFADATPVSILVGQDTQVDAVLASAGAIAGTVSLDAGGLLESGGMVYVVDVGGEDVGSTYVDLDGTYSVGSLPPGEYRVFFGDMQYFAGEWYHNATLGSLATPVTVTAGATTTVNESVGAPATISGTVTNPSGTPFGVVVAHDADGRFSTVAWTGVLGDYTLSGLGAGDYTLQFVDFPGAADEWYNNEASMAQAIPVTVGVVANVAGIDATLAPEAVISGTLTVPGTFTSSGACVGAFIERDASTPVGEACGDVGDPFSISALPAATYYLRMIDTPPSLYDQSLDWATFAGEDAWYDDAWTSAAAAPVALAAGQHLAITLSWTAPPAEVSSLSPAFGTVAGGTVVTLTGTNFTGATSVTFDGVEGTALSVASDTSLTVTTPAHWESPVGVVVTTASGASAAVEFAYVDLTTSGVIYGTVTGPGGAPAGGGTGSIGEYWYAAGGDWEIGASGTFATAVSPGDYRVCFNAFVNLANACHDDGSHTATSELVRVGVGEAFDASTELAPGGTIAGTVTGPGSVPASGGAVEAYDATGEWEGYGAIEADGTFSIVGLGVGNHYLLFYDVPGLAWSWSGGSTSLAAATAVSVSAAATTPYDIQLGLGDTIAGTVTGPGGATTPGGYLYTFTPDGFYIGNASADANGDYVTQALSPGDYSLVFLSFPNLAFQWSGGASSIEGATPVTVVDGFSTTYDIELPYTGDIDGTVSGPGGSPVGDGFVEIYSADGLLVDWGFGQTNRTWGGGNYGSVGLAAGETYYVRAHGFDGMADEWYEDALDFASATPVTFAPDATTTADIELAPPAPAPAITDVSPTSGPLTGGTTVTLTGTALTGATAVYFDGVAGTSLSVSSGTELTVVTPAHAAGPVSVIVTTPGGASFAAEFTYVAPPAVSNVSPVTGPTAGGTTVTLTGTGFTGATGVTFDGVAGTSLSVGSATSLTVVSPTHSAGPVDVVVTTAYGSSAAATFTYVAAPAVSTVSPASGPVAGGTTVTLTGSAFTGATGVTFDGVAGTSLSVGSATSLTVVSPAHVAGGVNVIVTTPYGSSSARTFTYVAAPAVSDVSPATGPTAGGTTVTLTGSAFTGATGVTFDGVAGTALSVGSATSLTVVSPAHAAGPVNVIVTTPYGSSVAATFTYVAAPAVSNVSPVTGPTAGGTTVTLTGSAFTGATGVTFDGVAGTSLSVGSATSLTVVSPSHVAGAVNVIVTTPYGSSSARTFTYVAAPAVSNVSPATGSTAGGTTVTLTGSAFTGATGVTFDGVAGTALSVGSATSLTVVSPAHVAGAVNVIVTTPYGSSVAATFTYVPAPAISNVSPAAGPTAGGTTVTLTGTNFTGATSVTFGGTLGTSLSVGSDSSLTVVAPSHSAGPVDVVVTGPIGSSSPATFTYVAAPAVSNVSPSSGPTAGGTTVTLTGSAFTGATGVTFDGVAGTSLSVGSATSLTIVSPTHAAGAVNVIVTTGYGSSSAATFTYVAAPAVTNVSPSSGATAGGTTVTLTGSAFTGATGVTFDGVAGTSLSVGSATSLTIVSPTHAAGPVDVVVTTPYGSSSARTFTYVAAPAVSDVSPATGPTAGGTTVTLTGSAFTGATGVTFGGVAGTSLSVSNDGSLTVTSPAHAAGAVSVVVTTPYGSSSAATFTYVAAPAVSTVSPSTGPVAGGTTVTLTGSAFTGATGVTFDGVAGTSLSVGSATSLTIVSPAHAAGAVNVIVTTPYGESTARTFTYVAAPAVSNVSPSSGATAGGTTVTLTGSAFTGATGVTFDGVAGTSLSVGSATSLTIVSPAHVAGAVDVIVTTPYGSSTAATFTYVAPPAVSDVSPAAGALVGGTSVTLTGSAFTGATSVTFGGTAGTSLSVGSATSLTVVSPAHAAGAVNVVVSTPYGSSSAATFTYVAAPAVTTVSPSSGPTVGGTTVTLTGSALTGATSVTFGGLAGASLSVGSDSSLTVTAPAHAAGAVNVLVTTPYGVSAARTFTYVAAPAVTNVSPSSGSTAGGTTVTLTGSAFTGATGVTFDGVAGTSLSVGSATSLTIVSPSHAAGAVDVVVTTPYGSSPAAAFTYVAGPVITNVSPSSGPVAGGTVVTLTGTSFTGATSVTFGGTAGTSLSVVSATSLTVTAPAHAVGPVNVVVATSAGSSAPATFTYRALPVIASVAPGFGPTTGGTTVTVTGSGFTDASQVTFGGVAGTGLSVGSDTSLTVTSPAGTAVRAPIVVTNPVGGSAPAAAAFFAYTDGAVVAGIPEVIADVAGFTPNVVRCYQVTGKAGVPVGAVGVVLNVTASLPNAPGHVRVYPDYLNNGASPAPAVSTVNFEVARDVANSTTISLPTGGKVCAYGVGGTLARLILDVDGYILPGSGIELITPEKLVDTRPQAWYHAGTINGPVQPMTDYEVQVGGVGSVPSDAVAVIANITVVDTRSPGHLRMWASDTAMPNTSVVNYAPETKANSQIVALSADGKLTFRSFSYVPTSVSPVQVLIDVTGYIAAGSDFVATVPTKLVETRSAYGIVGPITGALNNGVIYPVPVDTSVVPAGATAVILNVTAVQPTAFGHIRVYPDTNGLGTTPPPVMSNLNFIPGRDIPNMVIVQLPADRTIDLYTVFSGGGRTDLVVNIIGYIAAPTG